MADWQRATGRPLDLLGGWLSPSAQRSADPAYGAAGLTNILQLYSGLIEAGMDTGTVFGLGLPSPGALARARDIFIGGQLYGLMAESLPGKVLHEGFRDNTQPVPSGVRVFDGSVNSYVYEGPEDYAIFLVAKGLQGESQTVKLQFEERIAPAELTRLYEPGSLDRIEPSNIGVTGEIETRLLRPVTENGLATLSFSFREDFEVVRLVVPKVEIGIDAGSMGGTAAGDIIFGTLGDDVIDASGGDDIVFGRGGDDTIRGGPGPDWLRGDEGSDVLQGNAGDDSLEGGAGDDLIDGGIGADVMDGGPGADRILGKGGPDTISGSEGNDVLLGNADGDYLIGGPGRDKLFGGQGFDILDGRAGPDVLWGQSGEDILVGKAGADRLLGGPGNDRLEGGAGADRLFGGQGADRLDGGLGPDVLRGQNGPDLLLGRGGADRLFGGPGRDRLKGGPGDDILHGGPGDDRMQGNSGADTFVFLKGDGQDAILDMGSPDTILLQGSALGVPTPAALERRLEDIPGGHRLVFGEGDRLTVLMASGQDSLDTASFILI
jgi:Ca2+-binding RTX toxin-like protein